MFCLREKLFLVCFLMIFALAPGWAQMGGLQEQDFGGSPQFPGTGAQNGADAKRNSSGTIMGSVQTLSNKPVPNARIEVISLAQGQRTLTEYTSQDGSFVVGGLATGEYEVRAQSGVLEASARVRVGDGQNWVTMRVPDSNAARGGDGSAPTVSVQQLRVPDKAASLLAKAHEAMDKGKLDEAAKYVSKALAAYPEYAQALALRGVLELQRQQFDQAAVDANHAIQADPNYGTGYLVMGAALNCQKKYQEALRPLQQAEALLPSAWQGYFEHSKALLQMAKFQEALQQVNKAFTLGDPSTHPELHLVKGSAYLGLHTYGAALTEFEQYLSREPNGPFTAQVRSTLKKIRPLAAAAVAR